MSQARKMRWLGVLAIAVFVIACTGSGGAGPTIDTSPPGGSAQVTAPAEDTPPPGTPSPWIPDITPTLIDTSGLATEVTPVMPTPSFEEGLSVEGSDQPNLLISWLGSPCELEPTVVLEGTNDDLTVTVYRGPIEPGECTASQPARVLRIALSTAVDPASASFELRDGLPSG